MNLQIKQEGEFKYIDEGEGEVLLLSRVRLADGSPLAVENAYLPPALCPGLLRHDFTRESLYRVLEQEYEKQNLDAAILASEQVAKRRVDPARSRTWRVVNERETFTRERIGEAALAGEAPDRALRWPAKSVDSRLKPVLAGGSA